VQQRHDLRVRDRQPPERSRLHRAGSRRRGRSPLWNQVAAVLRGSPDMSRPSWDEYSWRSPSRWRDGPRASGATSRCPVKDKRILATGYTAVPAVSRTAMRSACLREQRGIPSGTQHELCRGIHAEQKRGHPGREARIAIDGADRVLHAPACACCARRSSSTQRDWNRLPALVPDPLPRSCSPRRNPFETDGRHGEMNVVEHLIVVAAALAPLSASPPLSAIVGLRWGIVSASRR